MSSTDAARSIGALRGFYLSDGTLNGDRSTGCIKSTSDAGSTSSAGCSDRTAVNYDATAGNLISTADTCAQAIAACIERTAAADGKRLVLSKL